MLKKLIVGLVVSCFCWQVLAQGTPRHGKIMVINDVSLVWHSKRQSWIGLNDFWLDYAGNNGAKFWGTLDSYPQYDQVQENDTLIIQTDAGPCLMEFFHERWRRANDVRRWDKAFNEYGGCSTVFDD